MGLLHQLLGIDLAAWRRRLWEAAAAGLLPAKQVKVLRALARFIEEGTSQPTIAQLAARGLASARTVYRALAAAEALGLHRRTRRFQRDARGRRHQRASDYRLTMPPAGPLPVRARRPRRPDCQFGRAVQTQRVLPVADDRDSALKALATRRAAWEAAQRAAWSARFQP